MSIFFEGLKPVQVKEIQDMIAKLPAELARPKRWRRCEQPPTGNEPAAIDIDATTPSGGTGAMEISTGSMSEIIDAYALSEPVNVLARIPNLLWCKLNPRSGKSAKRLVDLILGAVKVPKIEEGHFGSLSCLLGKRIADVNVSVVTVAAQCVEALAMGLRGNLSPHRSELITALLERCKEKNKAVLEALRLTLDSMIHCLSSNCGDWIEAYGSFLKHKNPQVRTEAAAWIGRCIAKPQGKSLTIGKKELKVLTEALLPLMDDGTADVREATAVVLSIVVRLCGDKQVLPFFEKLDKIKINKILDLANASAISKQGEQSTGPSNPPVQPKAIPPSNTRELNSVAASNTIAIKNNVGTTAIREGPLSFAHSDDEGLRMMEELVGEQTITLLSDTNWKVRLDAVEKLAGMVEASTSGSRSGLDSEILVRFFAQKPGWKESNFQVLNRIITLLASWAEKCSFTVESYHLLIGHILEKISDPKVGVGVTLLLTAITDRINLGNAVGGMAGPMKSVKNPRTLSEIFSWIATALVDFGVARVDVVALTDLLKFGLGHSNVQVRSSALRAAVNLRRFIGPDVRALFAEVAPAQLSNLDAEFAKVATEPLLLPTRTKSASAVPTDQGILDETQQQSTVVAISQDLVTRNDVTAALNALIVELNDSNWKIRKEGMDKATELINKNGNRIKLTNGDFLAELKGDSEILTRI